MNPTLDWADTGDSKDFDLVFDGVTVQFSRENGAWEFWGASLDLPPFDGALVGQPHRIRGDLAEELERQYQGLTNEKHPYDPN